MFFLFKKCGLWGLPCTPRSVMWRVGRSPGTSGSIVRHFTSSVMFRTCQHIWGTESQKPGTPVKGLPHLFLAVSVFPYSSHCLCIDSINSSCLLPTFGWGWEAVLAEMPWWDGCQRMLLLTWFNFLSFWGSQGQAPCTLAWKDIFRVFCLSLGGGSYLSYFPNKLNFIWLLWLWWGGAETGELFHRTLMCVGFLI